MMGTNKDNTEACYNCAHYVRAAKKGVIPKVYELVCSWTNEQHLRNDTCDQPRGTFTKKAK